MKQRIFLTIILIIASYLVQAQKCTISCSNITSAYVCPNSIAWKNNPSQYNDDDFMKAIGARKDNKGCWVLAGSSTPVTITPPESKKNPWWKYFLKSFPGAKKTGF